MTPDQLIRILRFPNRPRGAPPIVSRAIEPCDGYVVERLHFDFGSSPPVRGLLTRPVSPAAPMPAVLYCHAHGARYEIGASELLDGRPSLRGAYGPELARRGFVTLSIDMPTFGERAGQTEDALSKALLWRGQTLMGLMLADLLSAFDHLASRDDVDAGRIAAIGLSMGATHAYFLGAIEPRIARVAHLCCLADIAILIETGAHDLHGHYMTVPGLLEETTFGRIAGMVAPRPQLVCIGEDDALTPPKAFERAFADASEAYRQAGAADRLALVAEPGSGHVETARMRRAVLDFLEAMR
jgi:fermentation-respiration switch protein FrsA (DUF1100 family)